MPMRCRTGFPFRDRIGLAVRDGLLEELSAISGAWHLELLPVWWTASLGTTNLVGFGLVKFASRMTLGREA